MSRSIKSGLTNSAVAILIVGMAMIFTGCKSSSNKYKYSTGRPLSSNTKAKASAQPKSLSRVEATKTDGRAVEPVDQIKLDRKTQRQALITDFDNHLKKADASVTFAKFKQARDEVSIARQKLKKGKPLLLDDQYKAQVARADKLDSKIRQYEAAEQARIDREKRAKRGGVFDFK